jgi:hypothetical protein
MTCIDYNVFLPTLTFFIIIIYLISNDPKIIKKIMY